MSEAWKKVVQSIGAIAGRQADAMEKIAVWGFRWAPPLRRGWYATFACWALEEAGLPYEARLIGFEDLGSDAYRQRQFSTKEAIDMDAGWANTLDALEVFVAQQHFFCRSEDMNKAYTGGCACGAIRYEIPGGPMVMNDCQCRDCQRKSGTGHGSYLTFPGKGVKLKGEAKHWDIVGDSGKVKTRAFCPTCGSPVYMTFAAMPDLFTVHAASLDDPSRYKPQMVTYGVRGYAWDHIDPALPKFDKMPPM